MDHHHVATGAPRLGQAGTLEILGATGTIGSAIIGVLVLLSTGPVFESIEPQGATHGPGGGLLLAFVYAAVLGAIALVGSICVALFVAGRCTRGR